MEFKTARRMSEIKASEIRDVLEKCLESNVAFVPGGSFFPNGGKENTFRINFSSMPEDRIIDGVNRIGDVLKYSFKL